MQNVIFRPFEYVDLVFHDAHEYLSPVLFDIYDIRIIRNDLILDDGLVVIAPGVGLDLEYNRTEVQSFSDGSGVSSVEDYLSIANFSHPSPPAVELNVNLVGGVVTEDVSDVYVWSTDHNPELQTVSLTETLLNDETLLPGRNADGYRNALSTNPFFSGVEERLPFQQPTENYDATVFSQVNDDEVDAMFIINIPIDVDIEWFINYSRFAHIEVFSLDQDDVPTLIRTEFFLNGSGILIFEHSFPAGRYGVRFVGGGNNNFVDVVSRSEIPGQSPFLRDSHVVEEATSIQFPTAITQLSEIVVERLTRNFNLLLSFSRSGEYRVIFSATRTEEGPAYIDLLDSFEDSVERLGLDEANVTYDFVHEFSGDGLDRNFTIHPNAFIGSPENSLTITNLAVQRKINGEFFEYDYSAFFEDVNFSVTSGNNFELDTSSGDWCADHLNNVDTVAPVNALHISLPVVASYAYYELSFTTSNENINSARAFIASVGGVAVKPGFAVTEQDTEHVIRFFGFSDTVSLFPIVRFEDADLSDISSADNCFSNIHLQYADAREIIFPIRDTVELVTIEGTDPNVVFTPADGQTVELINDESDSVTSITLVNQGTFVIDEAGRVVFNPVDGFTGTARTTIRVTNPDGTSMLVLLIVEVEAEMEEDSVITLPDTSGSIADTSLRLKKINDNFRDYVRDQAINPVLRHIVDGKAYEVSRKNDAETQGNTEVVVEQLVKQGDLPLRPVFGLLSSEITNERNSNKSRRMDRWFDTECINTTKNLRHTGLEELGGDTITQETTVVPIEGEPALNIGHTVVSDNLQELDLVHAIRETTTVDSWNPRVTEVQGSAEAGGNRTISVSQIVSGSDPWPETDDGTISLTRRQVGEDKFQQTYTTAPDGKGALISKNSFGAEDCPTTTETSYVPIDFELPTRTIEMVDQTLQQVDGFNSRYTVTTLDNGWPTLVSYEEEPVSGKRVEVTRRVHDREPEPDIDGAPRIVVNQRHTGCGRWTTTVREIDESILVDTWTEFHSVEYYFPTILDPQNPVSILNYFEDSSNGFRRALQYPNVNSVADQRIKIPSRFIISYHAKPPEAEQVFEFKTVDVSINGPNGNNLNVSNVITDEFNYNIASQFTSDEIASQFNALITVPPSSPTSSQYYNLADGVREHLILETTARWKYNLWRRIQVYMRFPQPLSQFGAIADDSLNPFRSPITNAYS